MLNPATTWDKLRRSYGHRTNMPRDNFIPRIPLLSRELHAVVWEVDDVCRFATPRDYYSATRKLHQLSINQESALYGLLSETNRWERASQNLRIMVYEILGRPQWRLYDREA